MFAIVLVLTINTYGMNGWMDVDTVLFPKTQSILKGWRLLALHREGTSGSSLMVGPCQLGFWIPLPVSVQQAFE